MAQIDGFFKLMNSEGASDLFMIAGQQPLLRVRGDMEKVKFEKFDNNKLRAMLFEICPEGKIKLFEETGDVDFAYEIEGLARYRANFFNRKMVLGPFFVKFPVRL